MLKVFSRTDMGRMRKSNQDCVYTSDSPMGDLLNIFIVADGMGGHAAGELASRVAVNTMIDCIRTSSEKNPAVSIKKAVRAANSAVFARSLEDISREGMGTTIVACTFIDNVVQGIGILVKTVKMTFAAQMGHYFARVATTTEGGIHIDPVRVHHKSFYTLSEKNRHMICPACVHLPVMCIECITQS